MPSTRSTLPLALVLLLSVWVGGLSARNTRLLALELFLSGWVGGLGDLGVFSARCTRRLTLVLLLSVCVGSLGDLGDLSQLAVQGSSATTQVVHAELLCLCRFDVPVLVSGATQFGVCKLWLLFHFVLFAASV